jgi:NADH:ubiquinone oxidoreductase subunit E
MDFIVRTQEILDKYDGEKDAIMAILQDVQEEFGYVPRESVEHIAQKRRINQSQLF